MEVVMFKPCLAAVLIMFLPTQAWAVCTQADLAGFWRFNFDTGVAANGVTDVLSCILKIKANGEIVPGACQTVNFSDQKGEFFVNAPNRKLQMNTATCEARFSGTPVSDGDFLLRFIDQGGITKFYKVNLARLSISADKQMLLGWLGSDNRGTVTTTALKRATP
jgi:hypothetical protein